MVGLQLRSAVGFRIKILTPEQCTLTKNDVTVGKYDYIWMFKYKRATNEFKVTILRSIERYSTSNRLFIHIYPKLIVKVRPKSIANFPCKFEARRFTRNKTNTNFKTFFFQSNTPIKQQSLINKAFIRELICLKITFLNQLLIQWTFKLFVCFYYCIFIKLYLSRK